MKNLNIRVTQEEHNNIKKNAMRDGFRTISDYARSTLLKKTLPYKFEFIEDYSTEKKDYRYVECHLFISPGCAAYECFFVLPIIINKYKLFNIKDIPMVRDNVTNKIKEIDCNCAYIVHHNKCTLEGFITDTPEFIEEYTTRRI